MMLSVHYTNGQLPWPLGAYLLKLSHVTHAAIGHGEGIHNLLSGQGS